jgi:hypothetical protein
VDQYYVSTIDVALPAKPQLSEETMSAFHALLSGTRLPIQVAEQPSVRGPESLLPLAVTFMVHAGEGAAGGVAARLAWEALWPALRTVRRWFPAVRLTFRAANRDPVTYRIGSDVPSGQDHPGIPNILSDYEVLVTDTTTHRVWSADGGCWETEVRRTFQRRHESSERDD